jgi:PAS domain S-box-containing protein
MKNFDLNILYVEDEEHIRNSIVKILQHVAKNLFVAHDGEMGYELFKQNHQTSTQIDLVITDINMPKLNGFEMLEKIRALDGYTAAIITTAHSQDSFLEKAFSMDILNDFIKKPFDMQKLIERLEINEEKIIERKKYKQLQNLHKQYEYAVNKKLLVSKTDPEGVITYVNNQFCEVSGYSPEELLGSKHNIVKNPIHPPRFYEKMWEKITQKKMFHGIVKNKKKDGTEYIVDTTIIPILDQNGEVSEYISLRNDITKYAQERDQEISVMEDKTLMLFTHELKSPLNAIMSFISHISRGLKKELTEPKKEKLQYLAKVIDANAQSLLEIINSMLDISKLKSNKLQFHKEQFNLTELIETKIETYSVLHEREVEIDIVKDLVVTLDQKSLNHIIENLFTNAIKYSNSKVFLSLQKEDGKIIIAIEDDGDGIVQENRESIFRMFTQQAEGRSNKEKSGTGIGLHLVKLLCDNNNFTITIDNSKTLGGAAFIVTIPYEEK